MDGTEEKHTEQVEQDNPGPEAAIPTSVAELAGSTEVHPPSPDANGHPVLEPSAESGVPSDEYRVTSTEYQVADQPEAHLVSGASDAVLNQDTSAVATIDAVDSPTDMGPVLVMSDEPSPIAGRPVRPPVGAAVLVPATKKRPLVLRVLGGI